MTVLQSRLLKTAIIVLSGLLFVGIVTGIILIVKYSNIPDLNDDGIIMHETKYYMTEIRPDFFEDIHVNEASYLQLDVGKKAGLIHFEGKGDLKFIICEKNHIEFIRHSDRELIRLELLEENGKFVFKNVEEYEVGITQQIDPITQLPRENIDKIAYNSTIMVFDKGEA